MSMRLKRLQADYDMVRLAFPEGSPVSIKSVTGNPPEKYEVHFHLNGLVLKDGQIAIRKEHRVEIILPASYPRMAPQCRMLTPIFHPNIAPHAICIGDHWAAGESLVNLIMRIGEIIAYQSYNTKSPLNGEAARWTDQNIDRLPVDNTVISARECVDTVTSRVAGGAVAEMCSNCGAIGGISLCSAGHPVCANCSLECGICHKKLCLRCGPRSCTVCQAMVCLKCSKSCANCGRVMCNPHSASCSVCAAFLCADCAVTCAKCGRQVCLQHLNARQQMCVGCAPDVQDQPLQEVDPMPDTPAEAQRPPVPITQDSAPVARAAPAPVAEASPARPPNQGASPAGASRSPVSASTKPVTAGSRIATTCIFCGKVVTGPSTFAGKRAACPSCGRTISFKRTQIG